MFEQATCVDLMPVCRHLYSSCVCVWIRQHFCACMNISVQRLTYLCLHAGLSEWVNLSVRQAAVSESAGHGSLFKELVEELSTDTLLMALKVAFTANGPSACLCPCLLTYSPFILFQTN